MTWAVAGLTTADFEFQRFGLSRFLWETWKRGVVNGLGGYVFVNAGRETLVGDS